MQIPPFRPVLDSGAAAVDVTWALGETTLEVMTSNHDTNDLRLMIRIDLETHVGTRGIAMVEEIVLTEGGRIRGHGLLIAAVVVEMAINVAKKDEGHGHENGL